MEMPIEAASVYFLIGMCHSELSKPLDALSAFNNAIRVNPDYAEVTERLRLFHLMKITNQS